MASSFILLADLKAGRCSTTAKSDVTLSVCLTPWLLHFLTNLKATDLSQELCLPPPSIRRELMAQKIQQLRQKIEPLTVSELNEYVITADPQIFSLCIFTVKIGGADVPQAKLPEVDTQRSAVAPTKQQLGPEENEPKKERFE
ncbi:hypothetical protein F2Q69_00035164 [Brassica cretica]|uniref:Uncharacterized protein n=1 Tax=Brassica cretica TaxID=69181 RepID=A0A8S9SE22_BRACR|nr:hypothetical protein F2Q69_00035164 [Brassica cretica]